MTREDLLAILAATVAGDVNRLRAAFGDPADFPNVRDECGETCLEYAIYRGPVSLVRELLALGAEVNHQEHAEGAAALRRCTIP